MPLIINEKFISSGSNILYNDVDLQKIYCNGILVWQKYIAATGQITAGISEIDGNAGWPSFPGFSYSFSTLSADSVISWDSSCRGIKAKAPCSVRVSGAISAKSVDCKRVWSCITLYKNSSVVYTITNFVDAGGNYYNSPFSTGTINLAKGDICCIKVHSYDYLHGASHRTRYEVTSPIRFTATPL